jgi:hypothetical protein
VDWVGLYDRGHAAGWLCLAAKCFVVITLHAGPAHPSKPLKNKGIGGVFLISPLPGERAPMKRTRPRNEFAKYPFRGSFFLGYLPDSA